LDTIKKRCNTDTDRATDYSSENKPQKHGEEGPPDSDYYDSDDSDQSENDSTNGKLEHNTDKVKKKKQLGEQNQNKTNAESEQNNTNSNEVKQKRKRNREKTKVPNINMEIVPEVKYDQTEMEYFSENPSQITRYLFMGHYKCTLDKRKLKNKFGITHIVNCTNYPNNHEDHFKYEKYSIEFSSTIIKNFPPFFDLVTEVAKSKGRVLVACSDGCSYSTSLVIAFLMETKKISFFEAFIMVHKHRYMVSIAPDLLPQIILWGECHKKAQIHVKQRFKCLCGSATWTLLSPFDKTQWQNPVLCCCQYEEVSECPNSSCAVVLEEMLTKKEWREQYLKWGFTTMENITGNFENCEEYIPPPPPKERQQFHTKKEWTVFKCRRCDFLTHAVSKNMPEIVAIITNIKDTPSQSESEKKKKRRQWHLT